MKISRRILQRFVRLPDSDSALRALLDDLGLEVKRAHDNGAFTLELLANRGDHHCYEGIATEIAGRTGEEVCGPTRTELPLGERNRWEVSVLSDKCLVYTTTVLQRVHGIAAIHPDGLMVLEDGGLQSTLPAIDATNIANLELGQPTHAFDADTIVGRVAVRESAEGESARPLFSDEPVLLPTGTLVIADEEKVLAIAGVIGCEESKTTAATQTILLESATFDPVAVRKASRALGIHTDSSARFERGGDPSRPLIGAGRVASLLCESGAWQVQGNSVIHTNAIPTQSPIELDTAKLSDFLGFALAKEEVAERLGRYGFTSQDTGDHHLSVTVPTVRMWDVHTSADLYEEVAKCIGYGQMPSVLPPVGRGSQSSDAENRRRSMDDALVGLGFYEVITDGFYGRTLVGKYELDSEHALMQHIETTNALERAYGLLRTSGLGQALEAVALNHRWKVRDIKMYEHGRAFHRREHIPESPRRDALPCVERPILWAICAGDERPSMWGQKSRPADAHFMKGTAEQLGVALGMRAEFRPPDSSHRLYDLLHPNRQVCVAFGGVMAGVLGEVHPALVERFKIKRARPCYLELDTDALAHASRRSGYSPPPSWQPIERSLAFALPTKVSAGMIRAQLQAQGPQALDGVTIADVFDFEHEGVPLRAVTYNLMFDNRQEIARSADDVNQMVEALAENIVAGFGHLGVTQR